MKKIVAIVLIVSLLAMVGCRNNKLATESDIVKYVSDKYGIDTEIISVDSNLDGNGKEKLIYHMMDKNTGFQFDCESFLRYGGLVFHSAITDNYNYKKYEMNKDKINKLLLDNNISINEIEFDGKLSFVNVHTDSIEELNLDRYVEPASQLINLLDYKNMDTYLIRIKVNDQFTYKYFMYDYETNTNELHDLEKEVNLFYNIPENLISNYNDYFNEKYSGDIQITGINLYFDEYGDINTLQGRINLFQLLDENCIKYKLKYNDFMPDGIEFKQSGSVDRYVIIKIDVDEYRNDLNNNSLKDLNYYIKK